VLRKHPQGLSCSCQCTNITNSHKKLTLHTRITKTTSLTLFHSDTFQPSKAHLQGQQGKLSLLICLKMTEPLLRCEEEPADDNLRFVYILKLLKETISNGSKQHHCIFNVKSVSGPMRQCIPKRKPLLILYMYNSVSVSLSSTS
jgi:hypothetical protein